MEKSESSDSDSNSSNSWVLVYDNTPPTENANTFHLDCSREPIQELTEHDFLSAGSDFDSDTDGISVISESEQEEFNEKTSDLQYETEDYSETLSGCIIVAKPLVHETKKLFKHANIVGVGVVLTAVFLGSYTLLEQRNYIETGDFKDLTIYDDTKIDDNFLCKADLDNELDEIVDLTIACTYNDENKNVVQHKEIKQCVKVHYETKKSVKEIQSDSASHKNRIPLRDVMEKAHQILVAEPEILSTSYNAQELLNIDKHNSKEVDFKEIPLDVIPSYNQSKKHKRDIYTEKTFKNISMRKKERKEEKHFQKIKFVKSNHKLEVHHKKSKKLYKNKFKNAKRSYEVKFKRKYNAYNKDNNSKMFKDIDHSGEWYSNWHKARQQLRKHDLMDQNWSKKKPMQWYFKWMDGREKLRYKKSYKPYSS